LSAFEKVVETAEEKIQEETQSMRDSKILKKLEATKA